MLSNEVMLPVRLSELKSQVGLEKAYPSENSVAVTNESFAVRLKI